MFRNFKVIMIRHIQIYRNWLYALTDLIPRENVEDWLRYLRNEFPTIAFKASTQTQSDNLVRKLLHMLPLGDLFPINLYYVYLFRKNNIWPTSWRKDMMIFSKYGNIRFSCILWNMHVSLNWCFSICKVKFLLFFVHCRARPRSL